MYISLTYDGVEKLVLENKRSPFLTSSGYFANSLSINHETGSQSWLTNTDTEYTTSNYCVVHIHNDYPGQNGDFYFQENHHESQSGYMHYYYDVKNYTVYVEGSDKGRVLFSDALYGRLKVIDYDVPTITIPAGSQVEKIFEDQELASKYYIFGIVSSLFGGVGLTTSDVFITNLSIDNSGRIRVRAVNQGNLNYSTSSLKLRLLVAEKGT